MSIMIVQFLHTGGEHSISKRQMKAGNFTKDWNYGGHLRKYLHASGTYIKKEDNSEKEEQLQEDNIYFWGEWEPQSKVTPIENQKQGAFPHFIHEPFVEINESDQLVIPKPVPQINRDGSPKKNKDGSLKKDLIATNTDPFVFGEDGFYYSCCKQNRKYKDIIRQTKLQNLESGSIILFGSRIKEQNTDKPYFALDTVFVVGEDINEENEENDEKEKKLYKQSYTIKSYAEKLKFVQGDYCDIMNFKGWKESLKSTSNGIELSGCYGSNCTSNKGESEDCEKGSDFTYYRGASYDNKVNEMYSFVPCKIGSEGEKGFERVKLTEDSFKDIFEGIISNNLSQGVKYTETHDIQKNFKIWTRLCEIIENAECKDGCKDRYYKAVELKYTENEV